MKKIIYWVAAFLCMACSDDHGSNQENGGASGSVTEVTPVTSDLSVDRLRIRLSINRGRKWYLQQKLRCLPELKFVIVF